MFPIQQFLQFAMNPNRLFQQMGLNIPQNIQNNPDSIIQYLMNTGMISQQQYNSAVNTSNQLKKDPNFSKLFNNQNSPKDT